MARSFSLLNLPTFPELKRIRFALRCTSMLSRIRSIAHSLVFRHSRCRLSLGLAVVATIAAIAPWQAVAAESAAASAEFASHVRPLFEKYCYTCHGDGAAEGELALDEVVNNADRAATHPRWLAVWKNLRSQMMPPSSEEQPSAEERKQLIAWIERDRFQLDPQNPDPGRVTIRRLNRQEYRYTVRDLLGVDYNVTDSFPADDTGYGFDTIGDVLSPRPC
jgi:mono/diheme cytochrome c family protein